MKTKPTKCKDSYCGTAGASCGCPPTKPTKVESFIEKKVEDAKKFAHELQEQLKAVGALKDGSCIYCGANPVLFVNYLQEALEEQNKLWEECLEKSCSSVCDCKNRTLGVAHKKGLTKANKYFR